MTFLKPNNFLNHEISSFSFLSFWAGLGSTYTTNVKAKFQSRYAYKLYTYEKRVYEMWKKVIDYYENYFWDIFTKSIFKFVADLQE